MYDDTAISRSSVKQIMIVTLSNYSEILAIYKASRKYIWLRSMIQHIRESTSCGLSSTEDAPTTLFEDNAACIAYITGDYIKGDRIKHVLPNFFYTHELPKRDNVNIQ